MPDIRRPKCCVMCVPWWRGQRHGLLLETWHACWLPPPLAHAPTLRSVSCTCTPFKVTRKADGSNPSYSACVQPAAEACLHAWEPISHPVSKRMRVNTLCQGVPDTHQLACRGTAALPPTKVTECMGGPVPALCVSVSVNTKQMTRSRPAKPWALATPLL